MRICNINGCNRRHHAKGLCRKHYSKQQNKQYRQEHKKEEVKRMKQYHIDNKEKILKQKRQYYIDNKEHMTKYRRQWVLTLAGKASIKARKARREPLLKDLSLETVQRVYENNIKLYGTLKCCLCGKPIKFGDDSLEHLTPLSRGGNNDFSNLGIAHLTCNLRKHTMTMDEWFKQEQERGIKHKWVGGEVKLT